MNQLGLLAVNPLTLESIIFIINIVVTITLAVLVYRHNSRSATNILFVLLSIDILIWLIVLHISLQPDPILVDILTWARISMALATIQIALLFLFAHTFPAFKLHLAKKYLFCLGVGMLAIASLCLSPYVFVAVDRGNSVYETIAGPAFILFNVYADALIIAAIYLLWKHRQKNSGIPKQQLSWVMAGVILMYTLVISTIALPILFFSDGRFVPYHQTYTLIFLTLTAYAITRYRFMDIRIILRKSLIISLLLLFSLSLVVVILLLAKAIFSNYFNIGNDIVTLAAVVVLLMIFPKLKATIRRLVDHYIFTDYIDLSAKIEEFEKAAPQATMLEDLAGRTAQFIQNNFHIADVRFLVYDHRQKNRLVSCWPHYQEHILQLDDILVQTCQRNRAIIVADELRLKTHKNDLEKRLVRRLETLNANSVVSLGEQQQCYGLLLLGPKTDGQPLTTTELTSLTKLGKFLSSIVPQAASVEIRPESAPDDARTAASN